MIYLHVTRGEAIPPYRRGSDSKGLPMPRKHLFLLIVLLSAAAVAGLLALTRTTAVTQPASASTGTDAAISFRLAKLDRFERSLRAQLAAAKPAAAVSAPTTVYRRAPSVTAPSAGSEHEPYDEGHEDGEEDRDD
jgi:hypothetical protein